MSKIVKPTHEVPWICEGGDRRFSKGGRCPQPFLGAGLGHDAVRCPLDCDRQRRRAARRCTRARAYLHSKFVLRAQDLSPQIAAVELSNQRLRKIQRRKLTVIELLLHQTHYNREPIPAPISGIVYKKSLLLCVACLVLTAVAVGILGAQAVRSASAQGPTTDTPGPIGSQAYITNTFEGEPAINVRTGPSTIVYPIPCGSLPLGATAPALGASPGHDWVQIGFTACPAGVGWVYAANVTLTGALRVVEPPPTPTSRATATIDPTLQAAFEVEATETRLPTFTPPPPLQVPTFSQDGGARSGLPTAVAILAIALVGGIVMAASFLGRR